MILRMVLVKRKWISVYCAWLNRFDLNMDMLQSWLRSLYSSINWSSRGLILPVTLKEKRLALRLTRKNATQLKLSLPIPINNTHCAK